MNFLLVNAVLKAMTLDVPTTTGSLVHIAYRPFTTGEYVLVVIDAYSQFPEVDIVRSTSASAVIFNLDRIFVTHRIPAVIRSDNDPLFTSLEIEEYIQENGIQLNGITPQWPQANSEAESFMKPLAKAVRSAQAEGKSEQNTYTSFFLITALPHIQQLDSLQQNSFST